ncbi:hypothetical protein [Bacillus sp. MUM 13]|nr:hypothetical protein [Bacillus sp. MUM 13]
MESDKKKPQKNEQAKNVREEFGEEFNGDMNAAKIFDVLLSGSTKKKSK